MGKKSGNGGGGDKGKAARVFVLKVAMHCQCHGCIDKIRAAVRDLKLLQGVEAVDQSAVETSGEVKLLATADPESLRQRLRKVTSKNVDLLLPKEPPPPAKKEDHLAAALRANQQPAAPQYGQGAWASQQLLWNGGNYGTAAQAYPWAASSSSYPGAAAWGAYAYPPPSAPPQGHGAYYGGGAPAWHAHGHGY